MTTDEIKYSGFQAAVDTTEIILSTICKRMECVDAPSVRANYGAYLPLFLLRVHILFIDNCVMSMDTFVFYLLMKRPNARTSSLDCL